MDGNDRRGSQYGRPYQTPGPSRPGPAQPMGPPAAERYAQPTTPVRTDIGRPPMARPYLPSYAGYGYPEQQQPQQQQYAPSPMQGHPAMQGVEMQYSPAYVPDPSRATQVQASPSQPQYAPYAPGSMLPPAAPQSMYDTLPQFQQRQSTAIEVMASQFALAPQYMSPAEQTAPAHYMASQAEPPTYASAPAATTRPPLPPSFGPGPGEYPAMVQAQGPPEPLAQAGAQEALERGMREYQQQLRATFEAIIAGRLTEASEKLLPLSRWLLGSVTVLGLHHDDERKHAERIDLWREFNLCWEALGQKQKEVTERALRTRTQPADILSAETLSNLVDELVSMCDQLEQYGLVDYEMGVWEEQITHIFTVCLELLSRGGGSGGGGATQSRQVYSER